MSAHGGGRLVFETDQSLRFRPDTALTGGEVWHLQGVSVPFVLRHAGEEYTVVGECYLHGAEEMSSNPTFQRITFV
jgi:hypothetical protein